MTSTEELPTTLKRAAQDTTADVRSKRFYHPEIDILRFFAFLLVFCHHALPQHVEAYLNQGFSPESARWISSAVLSGGLGVDLFFVLSSYLITELFIREFHKYSRVNVGAFYIRRALRIWPLYYGFLALIIIVVPSSIAGYLDGKYKATFLLFGANWACALWGYPPSVAAPLWSVSIEEQFYLIWPIIILTFGIKRINRVAVVMIIIAFMTRSLLVYMGTEHPGIWCNTFARLDPIACGALVAVLMRGASPRLNLLRRSLMCLTGISLFVVASRYTELSGPSSLLLFPAAAVGSTIILLSCLSQAEIGRSRLLKTLIYLGRISYGLYVFHLLALSVSERLVFELQGATRLAVKFGVGAVLTLLLSVASYELFEKRFLRLKERFTRIPSRPV